MREGAVLSALDGTQLSVERSLGGTLQIEIERCVNLEPLIVEPLAVLVFELATHPLDKPRRGVARAAATLGQPQRIGARERGIGVADCVGTPHQLDDGIAALHGTIGKAARVVALRSFRQGRECRGLGKIQLAHRLSEVALTRRFDAVGAVAEVDLVEIELEDAVLGIFRLDHPGDFGFAQFAAQRLFTGVETLGKEVARELHRDRRKPLRNAARTQVGETGADDAREVDAPMRVEALVFRDDEGLAHLLRDVLELDQCAPFHADFGDEAAVGGVEA